MEARGLRVRQAALQTWMGLPPSAEGLSKTKPSSRSKGGGGGLPAGAAALERRPSPEPQVPSSWVLDSPASMTA